MRKKTALNMKTWLSGNVRVRVLRRRLRIRQPRKYRYHGNRISNLDTSLSVD